MACDNNLTVAIENIAFHNQLSFKYLSSLGNEQNFEMIFVFQCYVKPKPHLSQVTGNKVKCDHPTLGL